MMLPASNYLVCATPRTGSSVVCEALAATDVAGRPSEYMHDVVLDKCCAGWGVPRPATLLERLSILGRHTRTPNGVFGMKVMTHEFAQLLEQLPLDASLTPARVLSERILPGLRYLHVIRRDVLRQAVSYLRAKQTRHWSFDQARSQAPRFEPHYDFAALDKLVRKTCQLRAIWDEFFLELGTQPTRVYYEDFVEDRSGTVRGILDALGIGVPTPLFRHPMSLERQGDALNEEWVQRYHADVGGSSGLPDMEG